MPPSKKKICGKIKRIYWKVIGIDKIQLVTGYKYCYIKYQFYFCKSATENYKM